MPLPTFPRITPEELPQLAARGAACPDTLTKPTLARSKASHLQAMHVVENPKKRTPPVHART